MPEQGPNDSGSTLIQTGKAALTFTEMAAFVRDIEARPQARLLRDLEGLMALPESKYQLVMMVLRRKIRDVPAERGSILARMKGLQASANPEVVQRATAFLTKPPE
jgi:hypothetical protein